MERSVRARNTSSAKQRQAAALARLKAVKAGAKPSALLEEVEQDDGEMFDRETEEQYEQRRLQELRDGFESSSEEEYLSDDIDIAATKGKAEKKAKAKAKRGQKNSLTKMFAKRTNVVGPAKPSKRVKTAEVETLEPAAAAAPPAPKADAAPTPDDDDFLEGMLEELEDEDVPALVRGAPAPAAAADHDPDRLNFEGVRAVPRPRRRAIVEDMAESEGEEVKVAEEEAAPRTPAAPKPTPAAEAPLPTARRKGNWGIKRVVEDTPEDAPFTELDPTVDSLFEDVEEREAPSVADVNGGDLPLTDGKLRMFWYDAYEDAFRNPGEVFLFGKVQVAGGRFVSCCARVHNNTRFMYVVPRREDKETGEAVVVRGANNLYHEVKRVMERVIPSGREQGQRYRTRPVSRKYAFECPGVPREEAEYLELVYPYAKPALPDTLSGNTFSRIFGTKTSALENLLLRRGIKGPCWLELGGIFPSTAPVSWCKREVNVKTPAAVCVLPVGVPVPRTPPLTVMSLSLKTVINPLTHTHEIVAATMMHHSAVNVDGITPNERAVSTVTAVRSPGARGPGPQVTRWAEALPLDLPAKVAASANAKRVRTFPNERALLLFFLDHVHAQDPDVILGHNISGFDLDVILHRMHVHKNFPQWSRLGRLKRAQMPNLKSGTGGKDVFVGVVAAGRLVCDTYHSAKELIRETTYTLAALAHNQLGVPHTDIDPLDVPKYFASGEQVLNLCRHTEHRAFLALMLSFKLQVLPLTKQLTTLAGNLWSRSLKGARAERIEYLLLHEFFKRGYLLPDKEYGSKKKAPGGGATGQAARNAKARRKPAYSGGLVLEPKKGLYDKFVLLLDFNSLYPSIIQEYNICFTTVRRPLMGTPAPDVVAAAAEAAKAEPAAGAGAGAEDGAGGEEDEASLVPALPDSTEFPETGILPSVIRTLVERRREVKKAMKREENPAKKKQLDIRQLALKILANSMYGCLGFAQSRFFAKPIAALVTSQGREILQNTVNLAQAKLNLDVIYGDTDSIMIHTNTTDIAAVKTMGEEVKAAVNKMYKLLEIEIDGIFKSMLLLKKKKYAALVVNEHDGSVSKEMKGLDLVRRDWCVVSRELGKAVLDEILSGKDKEEIVETIHSMLTEFAADVRGNKLSLAKYVITKGMNKAPRDYPDAKNQPHLQVALRLLQSGRTVNVGDVIPYVICLDPKDAAPTPQPGGSPGQPPPPTSSKTGIAARAYHPDDVKKLGLTVDYEWYLLNQIHPPIARLCAPIAETSQAQLATCLGLDPGHFRGTSYGHDDEDDEFTPHRLLDDKERFKDVDTLPVLCQRCGNVSTFKGVTADPAEDAPVTDAKDGAAVKPHISGLQCTKDGCGGLWTCAVGRGLPTGGAAGADGLSRSASVVIVPDAKSGASELEVSGASFYNGLTLAIRRHIREHSQFWVRCDDTMCDARTRQQSLRRQGQACIRPRCRGMMREEYSAARLHNQLEYYESLFNAARSEAADSVLSDGHREVFDGCHRVTREALEASAYHFVDPSVVFGYVAAMRKPGAAPPSRAAIV